MNPKRTMIAGLAALIAVLVTVFNVFAFPAEQPAAVPNQPGQPNACLLAAAVSTQRDLDIPAHRSDYYFLDRGVPCLADALNNSIILPPAGIFHENQYTRFKDLQAELASGGETAAATSDRSRYYDFKALQADQLSH
jgi:hypothetical protein